MIDATPTTIIRTLRRLANSAYRPIAICRALLAILLLRRIGLRVSGRIEPTPRFG
jgi:hypothetical protein